MKKTHGGQSMSGTLRRVLLCSPRNAGWDRPEGARRWEELGYFHSPDSVAAQSQHDVLRSALESAGAEVLDLPAEADLSIDAVYAHDASLISDLGAIGMRMGKPARAGEPARHLSFLEEQGIPILGAIAAPGTAEAGDSVSKFRKRKGAIKLHTLIDLRGSIPCFVRISPGKLHDVNVLDDLPLEPGAFYIMDRGYIDFKRLHLFNQAKAFYVTRAKRNLDCTRSFSSPVDKTTGLRSDQTIVLRGPKSSKDYPDPLRRIGYFDVET